MIDWIKARQSGVNRARNEIGESKCKVFNAIYFKFAVDSNQGMSTARFGHLFINT